MRNAASDQKSLSHPVSDTRSVAQSRNMKSKVSGRYTKSVAKAVRSNVRVARTLWGPLSRILVGNLREITGRYGLSVPAGDLLLLEGRWYVTSAGLLRLGQRKGCVGINAILQKDLSDPSLSRWVFRATVYKSSSSRGFVGYGDADPSNCSTVVHGAEMRVAETRAVNRALRKAYGVGLCSVEELGSLRASKPSPEPVYPVYKDGHPNGNGSTNGQPRLRDQLSLLIRQYNLDPTLVKAYAADFCGTETLSGASRDLVESFISHLAVTAKEKRDALICKLNSYSQPQEARP
jgi:hypothetical protein